MDLIAHQIARIATAVVGLATAVAKAAQVARGVRPRKNDDRE